jgi:hypothetical protein
LGKTYFNFFEDVNVMRMIGSLGLSVMMVAIVSVPLWAQRATEPVRISGRYPHLAVYNTSGECGIGAVVPWADRLWFITYAPHRPQGSDDKLYELDADLRLVARPESVGGTPANRLIHRESNQLLIGPYLIDARRNVRVIPPSKMFARLTATARHLHDPANMVYYFDMEGLLYEANVHTLDVNLLYARPLPGWHAKGGYTGQGRLVLANNGEHPAGSVDRFKPFEYQFDPTKKTPEDAGALGDWDGENWRLIKRRQFTEITGPGGIHGEPHDNAPVWSVGWDKRSLLLLVMEDGQWHTFRLPKADYSYDGHHGWHTEWPRIREVVPAKGDEPARYLMNMHGGWFDFPPAFSASNPAGLKPIASHLKVTADFTDWNGRIVFACDDTAASGFFGAALSTYNELNGQSNSNLWFADWRKLHEAGRPAGFGGVWKHDDVRANEPSEPYLFAGYTDRVLHLGHASDEAVTFTIEIDAGGTGEWAAHDQVKVDSGGYAFYVFADDAQGQWVRVTTNRDAGRVTAYFHYGPGGGAVEMREIFKTLADIDDDGPWHTAVHRTEEANRITLGVLGQTVSAAGEVGELTYHRLGADMTFQSHDLEDGSAKILTEKGVIEQTQLAFDEASAIVTAGEQRYRLPRGAPGYDQRWPGGWYRANRELVTERSLMNVAGIFYVLPRDNSGGVPRIKPVATHNKRIVDFSSWRGLTVISGTRADAEPDGHYFAGESGDAGLWFGDIDDLWKLGKPVGIGGPWARTSVKAGEASDPYLMTGFDRKRAEFFHTAERDVTIMIEIDFLGIGEYVKYKQVAVPQGLTTVHEFPAGFAAHWVRLISDTSATVTATFIYE